MSSTSKTIIRTIFFILFDIAIIILSVYTAYSLRFDFQIPEIYKGGLYLTIAVLVVSRIILFYSFRIYDISWRHFGFKDTAILIYVTIFSTLILLLVTYIVRSNAIVIPRSIIAIEFFISLFLILALRVSKRLYYEQYKANALGKYSVIIADLDHANNIIRAISNSESGYYPIAVVCDEDHGMKINGIDVYSFSTFSQSDIGYEAIIVDKNIDIKSIYEKLNTQEGVEIKVATGYTQNDTKLENISVEDLLARHPKDLDKNLIRSFLHNKTILITGAGGSIGSEIARRCYSYGAKELILLDHSEYNLYAITDELDSSNVIPVMQTVLDTEALEKTFAKYKPEIVIHAAAYKHVPLVEFNTQEGIKNNIAGTKNVVDMAIKHKVQKFIMISTDKAVRPTNVMGTTKRICELYTQNVDAKETEIVAVRFGNVLGSSGSVIPKFKAQIASGGPITVTHPDITRYFMLIPEACELVLQAGAIGKGGEIFILDMGEPIKIVDLAKKMIELSGKRDIKIEFTGLRPGEKLYEELLIDESDAQTDYESITVAKPTLYDIDKLNVDIEELLVCEDIIAKLREIVPEFDHKLNT